MFAGFFRTSDRMRTPVTSLAIYTGKIREEDPYEYACFGTTLDFRYNSYSVAGADIGALRSDKRVFALLVLVARLMLEAGGDPHNREKCARELLRLMRKRDYDDDTKRSVLEFVRRALRLNDDDISKELKEEWNMIATPMKEAAVQIKLRNAFEDGLEEGLEKGVKQGKIDLAKKLLADGVSAEVIARNSGLTIDEVLELGREQ